MIRRWVPISFIAVAIALALAGGAIGMGDLQILWFIGIVILGFGGWAIVVALIGWIDR